MVRQVAVNTEAIGHLQTTSNAHTTSITNLNTRMDSVETTVDEYETRIEDCERAAAEITTYNQRIAEVEAEMQSCSDDVTQLTSDVGDLTTLVNGYNGRITQNESDITSLDGRVTSLEAYETSATSAMSALTARVATNETDIDNLELADVTLDTRMTTAEGKVTALETLCGDGNLNTTATDLTGAVNEVNVGVTNVTSRVSTLEGVVGDSNAGLVHDVAENSSDISALETTVGDSNSGLVKDVNDLMSFISPTGMISAYGGSSAPNGWLICDGSAVSRTDYADLFNVIGTSFGTGDGSTTFNLPDLRECTTKGAGTTSRTVGTHSAVNVGDFVDDRVQTHTHYNNGKMVSYPSDGEGVHWSGWTSASRYICEAANVGNNTGRTGVTTEVKAVGVNYIIKI